jgi:hypothetical protein
MKLANATKLNRKSGGSPTIVFCQTHQRGGAPYCYCADVIVSTNACVCVGADAPDAVTVTL